MSGPMFRGRFLTRALIAVMAISFVLGSSGAALACVSPQIMSQPMPMKGDCSDMGKANDCALACAPMCTAIAPVSISIDAPGALASAPQFRQATRLPVHQFRGRFLTRALIAVMAISFMLGG